VEISKKLDYALRMLGEAAAVEEGEVVSVRYAAEKNAIPYSFARTIQHEMVKAGLLETTRGPHGGMRLAIDATTTTLLDIVEAIEGPMRVAGSDAGTSLASEVPSRFEPVWAGLSHLIRGYLSSVTLHQLVVDDLIPVLADNAGFELIGATTTAD
jgi:Rrf2 family protein